MKKIYLSGKAGEGRYTTVDDDIFTEMGQRKWYLLKRIYVASKINGKWVYLHRYIMKPSNGQQVDHVNRDPLDNCRRNLRICTSWQNALNRNIQKNNTSGYTGVIWDKYNKAWRAQIKVHGKFRAVGYFSDIIDAVKAYNDAAAESFGEYARLNQI